jgi:hypothetical protein
MISKIPSAVFKFTSCVLAACFVTYAQAKAETLIYTFTHPYSEQGVYSPPSLGFDELAPVFDQTLGILTSFDVSLSLTGQSKIRATNDSGTIRPSGSVWTATSFEPISGYFNIACNTAVNRDCGPSLGEIFYNEIVETGSRQNSGVFDDDFLPGQTFEVPIPILSLAYLWSIPLPSSQRVRPDIWVEPSLWDISYGVRLDQSHPMFESFVDRTNTYNLQSELICPDCVIELSFEFQYTPAIPLPAAFPLFGTGLGILGFLGWRRRRQAQAV